MIDFLIPDKEFFSIGEVTKIVQVQAYVLRYWESEFRLLRPARRTSGQRKYTRKDIERIFKVKDLLYNKKYTISGAKKFLLSEQRTKKSEPEQTGQLLFNINPSDADKKYLKEIKKELEEILKVLNAKPNF